MVKTDFNNRVLVVSNNAFCRYNMGKTFESIFSTFPKNSVAQLLFSQNEQPDFDFCNEYFKITDTDVLKNLLSFTRKWGSSFCPSAFSNKDSFVNDSFAIKNKNSKIFIKLKSISTNILFFRNFLWRFGSWKTKKLFNWVENYRPTSIFLVTSRLSFTMEIALYLKKKYNIPLVVYFTDDYIIYYTPKNVIDVLNYRQLKSLYEKSVKSASLCFGIGELMCEEYKKYFNKEFYPLMNSVNIIPYKEHDLNLVSNSIIISFTGSLLLNRWKMIVDFANKMKYIQDILKIKFEISVYSSTELTSEISNSFNNSNISFKGFISADDIPKVHLKSDILLHVESDERYYRNWTKLCISTKIPEYLMSGVPVIAYGPSEVASFRILSDNNIGVVISSADNDLETLSKLNNVLINKNDRNIMAHKAYEFAVNNFEVNKVSEKFKQKMFQL